MVALGVEERPGLGDLGRDLAVAGLREPRLEHLPRGERSVALEPETENTWWLVAHQLQQRRDAPRLLDLLARYERQFDMQFDPDALLEQDGYGWLAQEPAYAAFAAARR